MFIHHDNAKVFKLSATSAGECSRMIEIHDIYAIVIAVSLSELWVTVCKSAEDYTPWKNTQITTDLCSL